jgi:hypothetical protein
MASEFYVLSALYRLGLEPMLTLGNKKGVDVYLPRESGGMLSVEVKAVAKKMDWMFGSSEFEHAPSKWVVLLCFNGAIGDLKAVPDAWVVPSAIVAGMIKTAGNDKTRYLPAKRVREELVSYLAEKGWKQLCAASV